MRARNRFVVFATLLLTLIALHGNAFASGAANDHTVIVLGSTVSGGASSREAVFANGAGYDVEVVDGSTWSSKTAAEFATYRALILGDATCSGIGTYAITDAEANRAVWGPVVNGNIILVGTDPVYHQWQGGDSVTNGAVKFAAAETNRTGAYVSLSCYYHGTSPSTPVPVLDQFGSFTVTGVGCYNDAHKVADHVALDGITDSTISNWSCSVHEAFDGFPSDFLPLAIARGAGTPSQQVCFGDESCGIPYIMARGRTLVPIACGNGTLETGEECDDGNTINGDGCSAQCKLEVCGNGRIDGNEQCDDGNTVNGDGCSAQCTIEVIPSCRQDSDCNDNNACTNDRCVDGNCLSNTVNCDDGNVCNGTESCNPDSGCVEGTPLVCDDGNVCNGIESCDPSDGCVSGTPLNCNDGNSCNGIEECDPYLGCTAGIPLDCSYLTDECHAGMCDPETIGCFAALTVESSVCNDCNDGIDNDADGKIDCEDNGCSALANLCSFAIVGTEPGSRYGVRLRKSSTSDGNVCSNNARVSVDVSILGSLDLTGSVRFSGGLPQSTISDYFANNGGDITTGDNKPLVGPDALEITDPANTYVSTDGTQENFTKCVTALSVVPVDAALATSLTPTQSVGAIHLRAHQSTVITVGSGQNVVAIDSVVIGAGTTLQINGANNSVVVLRVSGPVNIGHDAQVVLNGVTADHVLWSMEGGRSVRFGSRSVVRGTVLAADRRKVKLSGFSEVDGAVFGKQVNLQRGASVVSVPFNALLVP